MLEHAVVVIFMGALLVGWRLFYLCRRFRSLRLWISFLLCVYIFFHSAAIFAMALPSVRQYFAITDKMYFGIYLQYLYYSSLAIAIVFVAIGTYPINRMVDADAFRLSFVRPKVNKVKQKAWIRRWGAPQVLVGLATVLVAMVALPIVQDWFSAKPKLVYSKIQDTRNRESPFVAILNVGDKTAYNVVAEFDVYRDEKVDVFPPQRTHSISRRQFSDEHFAFDMEKCVLEFDAITPGEWVNISIFGDGSTNGQPYRDRPGLGFRIQTPLYFRLYSDDQVGVERDILETVKHSD